MPQPGRRPDRLRRCGRTAPVGRPGADGGPEREVQALLRFKTRWTRTYAPARWAGRDAPGDAWEPLRVDGLTFCEEALAPLERATGRPPPRRALPQPAAAAAPARTVPF